MKTLKRITSIVCLFIFVLALSPLADAGGKTVVRSRSVSSTHSTHSKAPSASSTVTRYGRSSYSIRSSNGVKTNVSSYGRGSYLERTYGPGGHLQSTRTIVPYGNGWLVR